MNLPQFRCSLRCVSVIDRFQLVLRFFWTVRTSENSHSRKHPLNTSIILRWNQVSRPKLGYFHFQFRWNFLDKSTLYSIKIYYLIAFQRHPSRPLTTIGQENFVKCKFAVWKWKFYAERIKCYMRCSHHSLPSALQCPWISIRIHAEQKRGLKHVNTRIWGEMLLWSFSLWSFRCALDDQLMPWI